MTLSQHEALRRYNQVRDELRARSPEQWAQVVALCQALPDRIDADAVWRYGRDKPCYANIKVAIGERAARDIALSPDMDDWRRIASSDWAISLLARGPSWKRNSNFRLEGRAVQSFVDGLAPGGLKSYLARLYSIRELALALLRQSLVPSIQTLMALSATPGGMPPELAQPWTNQFARHAGLGWGHTTAYHLLTDLGLSVKPDIWLTTSMIRMGLLAPTLRADLPVPELARSIHDPQVQHLAAQRAMTLSIWITATAGPATPRRALRELDKVLMEWSRQGLARPLG